MLSSSLSGRGVYASRSEQFQVHGSYLLVVEYRANETQRDAFSDLGTAWASRFIGPSIVVNASLWPTSLARFRHGGTGQSRKLAAFVRKDGQSTVFRGL